MENILKNYRNLKVLITGSTGFKGSWLSFWLKNNGAKVVGVSLEPEKKSVLFKSFLLKKNIKQYFLDLKNFNGLNKIIVKEKPDIIFHLAAQSIVSSSYEDPIKTFESNILGSTNILESFRLNKIPALVFITSDKCYLNLDTNKSYNERDVLGGLDNYSASKASAELVFSSYFHSYFKSKIKNLNMASARAGNVIGGGDLKIDRIFPDIFRAIKEKKKIIIRNPNSTRPWQHVLEPLSGYIILGDKLLNKKLTTSILPSWNFGPTKKNCKKVIELIHTTFKYWNVDKKIYFKKNKMHEAKYLSLDIKKSEKELNWKPTLNFNETIELTVDWYKSLLEKKNLYNLTLDQINFFLSKKNKFL